MNVEKRSRSVEQLGTIEQQIEAATRKREEAYQKLKQLKALRMKVLAQQRAVDARRQRAEDNQTKYAVGGLASLAGLLEMDRGALLGAFLIVADRLKGETFFANCKQRGDELLAQREAQRLARKAPEGATMAADGEAQA